MRFSSLAAATVAGVGVLAALVGAGAATPPLEAAGLEACSAVSAGSLGGLERAIERSLKSAEEDVRKNAQSGKYPVATTNNRDLLVRSRDRVGEAVVFLRTNSPKSTNYAEAGKVKEYLRTTIPWLATAAHWATVSASWHRSTEARDSFDATLAALDEAQRLLGESGRCFMANYL